MRRRKRRPAVALACAVCLAACGSETPHSALVVDGRLEAQATGGETAAPTSLKLGTQTRKAFAVSPTSSFSVEVDAPQVLALSLALRGGPERAGVHFRVEARSRGAWREVLSETLRAGEDGWRDRRVDLARAAPGPSALRFTTRPTRPEASGSGEPRPVWGSPLWLARRPASRARPNVVLLSLDTLGAGRLSAFAGPAGASPHIDAFLDEGFSFRRTVAQYGNTLVSHASLFSALYPIHHQVYPFRPLPELDSLVARLAEAGYWTVAFTEGAFVSANFGFSRGFDAYDDGMIGLANQMAGGAADTFARAARWLEQEGRKGRFFLFVHTYEVHAPYLPRSAAGRELAASLTPEDPRVLPPEWQATRALAHNSGAEPLSRRDLARLAALHAGEVRHLDAVVGDFLDHLEALDLARDTLVVLTSDHGEQFGEHGKVGHSESLHNAVLHVPLGFRLPGVVRRGESERPVQLVDVMPTILDLADLPLPEHLDGRSLAPLLRGEGELEPRPAFSEQRSARGECRRLELASQCRLDRYAVQTGRFKWVSSRVPPFERLYDLRRDPQETRDVSAAHPQEAERHRRLLRVYLEDAAARDAEAARSDAPRIDEATRERLEELGYLHGEGRE